MWRILGFGNQPCAALEAGLYEVLEAEDADSEENQEERENAEDDDDDPQGVDTRYSFAQSSEKMTFCRNRFGSLKQLLFSLFDFFPQCSYMQLCK